MIYVVKFEHENTGTWRYFVEDRNSPTLYTVTSAEYLADAKKFDDRIAALATQKSIKVNVGVDARVYIYHDKKELFKAILREK